MPAGSTAANYTVVGPIGLTQFADSIRALGLSNNQYCWCALTQVNLGTAGYPANLATATPWCVTLHATFNYPGNTEYDQIAVCVANGVTSGTSVAYGCVLDTYTLNAPYLVADEVTVNGTRVSAISDQQDFVFYRSGRDVRLRILNDGVNLHYQYAAGEIWMDLYSQITPTPAGGFTYWGFWMGNDTMTGGYSQATIYSNSVSIPVQYAVTSCTGTGVPIVLGIGSNELIPGDLISVHGVTGNTVANTSSPGAILDGCWIVISTTGGIMIGSPSGSAPPGSGVTGSAPWTGGGIVTLLSR